MKNLSKKDQELIQLTLQADLDCHFDDRETFEQALFDIELTEEEKQWARKHLELELIVVKR